jgi:DNA-binding NtrC family response regulator
MQVKLLRVLQEQSLRRWAARGYPRGRRIIAATTANLKEEVAAGRFRRDLYYRVAVVTQEVPPLRSRPEDIPLLARYFLEKLADGKTAPLELEDSALQALRAYPFPGNVRELGNILERAAVFCPQGGRIGPACLPPEVREATRAPQATPPETAATPDAAPVTTLAELERAHILQTLDRAHGNRTLAADMLGISRSSLWRKLRQYGVE